MDLAAEHDITALVVELVSCLDDHRFDELTDVLTEDASVSSPGGVAAGRDKVIAQATRNHTAFARTQHLMTGIVVRPDDDGTTATARSNLLVTMVPADGTPMFQSGAGYRFTAARTGHGWRLATIDITQLWSTRT